MGFLSSEQKSLILLELERRKALLGNRLSRIDQANLDRKLKKESRKSATPKEPKAPRVPRTARATAQPSQADVDSATRLFKSLSTAELIATLTKFGGQKP